jgi:predicted alpha/beta superfamily hydrolase
VRSRSPPAAIVVDNSRMRSEGDREGRRERLNEASSNGVAGDEAASNPWHGAGGCGSAGTAVADDTKQLDA